MPIEILSLDDIWKPADDANYFCHEIGKLFSSFSASAKQNFADREYGQLGAVVTSADSAKDHFVVRYVGKDIRFSFTTTASDGQYLGLVAVHMLPRHDCFEDALPLGEFSFSQQGDTSLTIGPKVVSLSSRKAVVTLVMHFCLQAAATGFAPKVI